MIDRREVRTVLEAVCLDMRFGRFAAARVGLRTVQVAFPSSKALIALERTLLHVERRRPIAVAAARALWRTN